MNSTRRMKLEKSRFHRKQVSARSAQTEFIVQKQVKIQPFLHDFLIITVQDHQRSLEFVFKMQVQTD